MYVYEEAGALGSGISVMQLLPMHTVRPGPGPGPGPGVVVVPS